MGNRIIGVGDAPKWTLFSLPCKLVVSDRDERGVGSSPVAELTLMKHLSPIRRAHLLSLGLWP
jgi:hypothetical protein